MKEPLIVERIEPDTLSWKLYSGDHLQRYKFFMPYYKDKVVLDAACGSGYGTNIIANAQAKKVVGIDIDKETIQKNISRYNNSKIVFYSIPCEEIDTLEDTFDVVVSFETIEHLHNPEIFLEKVKSKLKNNGFFICSTPNTLRFSQSISGRKNDYHIHELSFEEFKFLFEKHFIINKIYHQSETPEFMRFLKNHHDLFQLERQFKSTLAYRFENFIRKTFNKTFQPISFFYDECFNQREEDFIIEEITTPQKWHKTFIITGQPK